MNVNKVMLVIKYKIKYLIIIHKNNYCKKILTFYKNSQNLTPLFLNYLTNGFISRF